MTALHDFTATTLEGTEKSLGDFAGKAVVVVNTASRCGLTPQFEGLQALYSEFKDQGLEILGFPCNQFAGQEPGTAEEAGEFCQRNYGVEFPMFEKVNVNGSGAHPLWTWLRKEKKGLLGGAITWNFTKFLIGKDGRVIERFAPTAAPEEMREAIVKALAA